MTWEVCAACYECLPSALAISTTAVVRRYSFRCSETGHGPCFVIPGSQVFAWPRYVSKSALYYLKLTYLWALGQLDCFGILVRGLAIERRCLVVVALLNLQVCLPRQRIGLHQSC